ncbi:AbrB/MazE/SpoVT family DNA-binding domain-containing protein [Marinomonas sp. 2405UD68-3]|uniref:AbrB/MazE/SpoVT family DNA-binding domain-containing protein n=1 Tax=Marinomonas sp. 2405UD68-3 TaxID=3391835 RepID=UPI0039C9F860
MFALPIKIRIITNVITMFKQEGAYMRNQIRKIGNSLGSIIPAVYIKELGLTEGDDIEIKIDGQVITIESAKMKKKIFPYSESELLKDLDAYTAHADNLATISNKEFF